MEEEMVFAVRGAIQVEENASESILSSSARLVREICLKNGIAEDSIVSILFSVTEDLTAANPAAGLRRHGFIGTPLFCVQEARVEGGMPRVIRVLLTAEIAQSPEIPGAAGRKRPVPVYLDGAEALRPDLQT